MEPLVSPVQDLLTPYAFRDCFVNVVAHLEHGDALSKAGAGVLGGLEQARDKGCLEGTVETSLCIKPDEVLLMLRKTGLDLPLPLRVLTFKRVQRCKEGISLRLAARLPGPPLDVFICRRLVAVLQLGDLGGWPCQRLRELPSSQMGLLA